MPNAGNDYSCQVALPGAVQVKPAHVCGTNDGRDLPGSWVACSSASARGLAMISSAWRYAGPGVAPGC